MPTITEVTSEDVERLSSNQLVELLRILLYAEARKHCVSKAGIHVPFQITVPDGGNDGEWNSEVAPCDYIPSKFTIYQAKAQAMGPKACASEVLNGDGSALKSQVLRILDAGGSFVFFCRKGYVKEDLDDKIQEVRNALKGVGRASWESDDIRFLDGNQIASWANQHAAAFVFTCRCSRHWQFRQGHDYASWSQFPENQTQFQHTDTILRIIDDIRTAIQVPKGTARMTGHSGLGKTRIAFEVFDSGLVGDSLEKAALVKSLQKTAVYFDLALGDREVLGIVDQLSSLEYDGIVIVDNCPREQHTILTRIVGRSNNRLSLLTLDYEPEVAKAVPLEVELTPEIMSPVVPLILRSNPNLIERITEAGVSRITEFAQGFPQIAILLAEAGQALDYESLNGDGRIADRLLWGRSSADESAKRILQCLSIFHELGRSGKHANQLEYVRHALCSKISEHDFNVRISRFRRKRILQEVGDFYMVAPPPLAAALAADWLYDFPENQIPALLKDIESAGLLSSFTKRMRQLDFSPRAREISEQLTGVSGPFSSAEVLNSEAGSQVFRTLAELNPLAALNCLDRVLGGWSPGQFATFTAGRRNIVWSLEKLVWDKELFPKAARLLRGFASGETETYGNNASGQFLQLFHILLSGTEQPLLERLELLHEGLQGGMPETVQVLTLKALGEALRRDRFIRSSGAEQRGSQLPREDYRPRTYQEVWDYWREAFFLLQGVILRSGDEQLSARAQSVLGDRVGTLVTCPLGKELYEDFKRICEHIGNSWPSARDELKRIRSYHKPLPAKFAQVIDEWLALLTPSDLATRLVDTVSVPGWHQEELPEGGFKDLSEEAAIQLADELYANGTPWKEHLRVLLSGDQQQTHVFGRRCMELDPDPTGLMRESLDVYKAIEPVKRNAQLLRGMVSKVAGTEDAEALLDTVAADPSLRGDLLVPLSTAATASIRDFKRVVDLVKAGELSPEVVDYFSVGRISQRFGADEFKETLESLIAAIPGAAPAVIRLVSMFYFHDAERFAQMRDFVTRLVLMPEVIDHINGTMIGHSWKEAVQALLSAPPDGFVEGLAAVLADRADSGSILSYNYSGAAPVLRDLLQRFPKQVWPVFEARIRDEEGRPNYSLVDLLCQSGRLDDSGVPLWELDADHFREWAERNRDLMPYLLHHMPLYRIEPGAAPETSTPDLPESPQEGIPIELPDPTGVPKPGDRYVWHPLALVVAELCGKGELHGALSSNIFSFGSTGSRVPYLEKRLQLMADLAESDVPDLKLIAQKISDELKSEIEREKKNDAQRAAGIYAW